jgi:hypothetical protein
MNGKMSSKDYLNLLDIEEKRRKANNLEKWQTLKDFIYNFRNHEFLERDWYSWRQ